MSDLKKNLSHSYLLVRLQLETQIFRTDNHHPS